MAKAKTPAKVKSKTVSATGIAVGGHGQEKTPLGAAMEEAMHKAILMGRSQGETDDEVRDRIHKARDEVLAAHLGG